MNWTCRNIFNKIYFKYHLLLNLFLVLNCAAFVWNDWLVQTLTEPRAPWKSRNKIISIIFYDKLRTKYFGKVSSFSEDISLSSKNILVLRHVAHDSIIQTREKDKVNFTFLNAYSLLIWWRATYLEQKRIRSCFRARKFQGPTLNFDFAIHRLQMRTKIRFLLGKWWKRSITSTQIQ